MSQLGFIPDFYFNQPLTALSTPASAGCAGCGVAGPVAEQIGYVMVDESPLGMTTRKSLVVAGSALGIFAGIFLGLKLVRRRRR